MKVIQNESKLLYYDIGDIVDGDGAKDINGIITDLMYCTDQKYCSTHYPNFGVCGGYQRIVNDNKYCLFVRADKGGKEYLGIQIDVPLI